MKNCELNVRTLDEGSIDEKSGMNFSEYIAILSGDTTLLEKSMMEKKIAVLESLRNAHHKEVIRSRFQLEHLQTDKEKTEQTLGKLMLDESNYKKALLFDKDGTKLNPIQLDSFNSADAEAIGIYLIRLSANWKPNIGEDTMKIGSLYGFDLYIRRQKETYEENAMFEYRYQNVYYAESPTSGIRYSWNQGHINIDNPKIAARYFLNAIDRVDSLKEKYQKNLKGLEQDIPMLQQLVSKPFEKENELAQLKKDVSKLEREITIKIQKSQLAQDDSDQEKALKEAPVIKIEKSLLPKKENDNRKKKSVRI